MHSRIRTSIMALLVSLEEAEFNFIKEKVNATDGNLSVHLKKLEEAGYVSVKKLFVDRKPVSRYKISNKGFKAFENYIKQLESIVKKNN
ncbi:MAG: transcriptional regulator [Ignavibacteria bacterium]|nr:transcriptional regulator [Ignavibacteria bacterium]